VANSTSKLAGVTAEVFQGIKTLARTSDHLSRLDRAAINGVFGGVLCATAGYVASVCYRPLNTPVFLVLITMTGLSGGVALTRLLAEKSGDDSLQSNNAVFAELIERSQNPAFPPIRGSYCLSRL
jgi:hypothetical protein